MTISTILGLGARSSTTTSPGLGLGLQLGHRPYAQHRGDIWVQSDGWKGGGHKKGDSAALSALTLLAFLFFLNILQSCLQDLTYQQQSVWVAAQPAGGREEIPAMMAMPVAMPPAMMPAATPMPSAARSRREASAGPLHAEPPDDQQVPIGDGVELCEQCDALERPEGREEVAMRSEKRGWEVVPVLERRRPLLQRVPVAVQTTSSDPDPQLEYEQRVVSITPAPAITRPPFPTLSRPTASVELYRLADLVAGGAVASFSPAKPIVSPAPSGASASSAPTTTPTSLLVAEPGNNVGGQETPHKDPNKQEVFATVAPVTTSSSSPIGQGAVAVFPPRITLMRPGGAQVVAFVPLGGALSTMGSLGPVGSVGSMAWRALSAVTRPIMQFMSPRLRLALCCDLVLCETRRIARMARLRMGGAGGAVASALSGVASWACGTAGAGPGAETKQDELEQSCRPQIEQCEQRAGRRTAVTTIASLLDAFMGTAEV